MSHTANLSAIGKLEIGAETEFGDEAAGANYTYLRTMPIDRSSLTVTSFRDEHQRQLDVETSKIIGPHTGSLSIQSYLHGFSSTVPAAAPTHTATNDNGANGFDFIIDILAGALGNVHTGGFTDAEAGSTTSVLKLNGTTLANGQFVAWQDSNSTWHVNSVQSQDLGPNPDEFTLLQTATAVPANGKVWGAHTIFQTTDAPFFDGTVKGFSLRYTGAGADDRTVMLGCWPSSLSMELPVGELPTMSVDFMVSHWREDALASNLGIHSGVGADNGGLSSSEAWAFPTCEAVTQAHVSLGSSQADERQVQGISFDLGLEIAPIKDANASSGIGGFFVVKRTPKITLTMMRDVSEEITDFFNQTGRTLTCWAGSQAGRLIALQMPNAKIEEGPAPSDTDGAVMSQITFIANEYTSDGGDVSGTDNVPGDKVMKIGFI